MYIKHNICNEAAINFKELKNLLYVIFFYKIDIKVQKYINITNYYVSNS